MPGRPRERHAAHATFRLDHDERVVAVTNPSPGEFFLGLVLSTALSLLVFRHAERHGSKRATAWGLGTFLLAALVVPLYFVRFWLRGRR